MLLKHKIWLHGLIFIGVVSSNANASGPLPTIALTRESTANTYHPPQAHWCNDTFLLLNRARERSRVQSLRGQHLASLSTLKQALSESTQSEQVGHPNKPATLTALLRAQIFLQTIENALENNPNSTRTSVLFLDRYFQFVIETMGPLDQNYYLPYLNQGHCYGGCSPLNMPQFEYEYLAAVRSQMTSIIDSLTVRGPRGLLVPLGSPIAFARALQLSVSYAIEDLQFTPFAPYFGCKIKELEFLAWDIESALQNSVIYPNELVDWVNQLEDISAQISILGHCNY
jgi:hypothetical protein